MAICLVVCLCATVNAQNEAVTNETVISLLGEGFGTEDIIGLIEMSPESQITFDINFMRQLKDAGAEQDLVAYLRNKSKADHGYEGLYLWNPSDGGKPKKLHRSAMETETKSGGGAVLGFAGRMTGVIGHNKAGALASTALASSGGSMEKVVVPGEHARIVCDGVNGSNPVFRFYFPRDVASDNPDGYLVMMSQIESPNEFQCLKLKEKKNSRTFPKGSSFTAMGFSVGKSGGGDAVDFEITDINNSTYEVTFPNGLEPGEYCFLYKNGLNHPWFQQNMFVFDFSVQ